MLVPGLEAASRHCLLQRLSPEQVTKGQITTEQCVSTPSDHDPVQSSLHLRSVGLQRSTLIVHQKVYLTVALYLQMVGISSCYHCAKAPLPLEHGNGNSGQFYLQLLHPSDGTILIAMIYASDTKPTSLKLPSNGLALDWCCNVHTAA